MNGTDMVIFIFRAQKGAMRSQMLVFDGIVLLLPIALGVWLLRRRSIRAAASEAPVA